MSKVTQLVIREVGTAQLLSLTFSPRTLHTHSCSDIHNVCTHSHIHSHMCTRTLSPAHLYTFTYIYILTYAHRHTLTPVHTYTPIQTYIFMYTLAHLHAYPHTYTSTCVVFHIHAHTLTYAPSNVHMHHTRVLTHVHIHRCITHTCSHTQIHHHTLPQPHVHMCTRTHTYARTLTRSQLSSHTYTHSYTNTLPHHIFCLELGHSRWRLQPYGGAHLTQSAAPPCSDGSTARTFRPRLNVKDSCPTTSPVFCSRENGSTPCLLLCCFLSFDPHSPAHPLEVPPHPHTGTLLPGAPYTWAGKPFQLHFLPLGSRLRAPGFLAGWCVQPVSCCQHATRERIQRARTTLGQEQDRLALGPRREAQWMASEHRGGGFKGKSHWTPRAITTWKTRRGRYRR